jgi:hypothetical protein
VAGDHRRRLHRPGHPGGTDDRGGLRAASDRDRHRGEWEEFESGLALDREEWLLANSGHPQAGQVRAELDKARNIWLRGHRDVFGFAYLTLGVP